jgi:hypothetical protein
LEAPELPAGDRKKTLAFHDVIENKTTYVFVAETLRKLND